MQLEPKKRTGLVLFLERHGVPPSVIPKLSDDQVFSLSLIVERYGENWREGVEKEAIVTDE